MKHHLYTSKIHTDIQQRNIITTAIFGYPNIKVTSLGFIGAQEYYITEYGLVWNKQQMIKSNGIVSTHYAPLVYLDSTYHYPWVNLYTNSGRVWFPINQLVGWAFSPSTNQDDRYFVTEKPCMPMDISSYKWVKDIEDTNSFLYKFVHKFYL